MTLYKDTQLKKDIELARYNGAYQAASRFYQTHWQDCRNNGITRQYVLDLCNYYASNIHCKGNTYNVLQRTKYIRWTVYGLVARDLRKEFSLRKEYANEDMSALARHYDTREHYRDLHSDLHKFLTKKILPDHQKRILKYCLETNTFNREKIAKELDLTIGFVKSNVSEILKCMAEYFRVKYPALVEGPSMFLGYDTTIDKKNTWEHKTERYFRQVLTKPLFKNEFIKFHGKRGNRISVLDRMVERGEIVVVRKPNKNNELRKAYVLKEYCKRGKYHADFNKR